jgi:hypothetical protein
MSDLPFAPFENYFRIPRDSGGTTWDTSFGIRSGSTDYADGDTFSKIMRLGIEVSPPLRILKSSGCVLAV